MKHIIIMLMVALLCGCTVSQMSYLGTQTLDGHVFIYNKAGGVLHHPDCPCGKKEAR